MFDVFVFKPSEIYVYMLPLKMKCMAMYITPDHFSHVSRCLSLIADKPLLHE